MLIRLLGVGLRDGSSGRKRARVGLVLEELSEGEEARVVSLLPVACNKLLDTELGWL